MSEAPDVEAGHIRFTVAAVRDFLPSMLAARRTCEILRPAIKDYLNDVGTADDTAEAILDGDLEVFEDWCARMTETAPVSARDQMVAAGA